MPEGTLSFAECLALKADFDRIAPSIQPVEFDFNSQQFHVLRNLINIAVEQEDACVLYEKKYQEPEQEKEQ
jgi:hypothetical protein